VRDIINGVCYQCHEKRQQHEARPDVDFWAAEENLEEEP